MAADVVNVVELIGDRVVVGVDNKDKWSSNLVQHGKCKLIFT